MADPLISICIPTYNGEKYLKECIDSCLNQLFADYEIIICDDKSSDNTAAIIAKYAEKEPKIRYFVNDKNLGLVGNWNRCIELARGQWIKFLFQDDAMEANCLQKFYGQFSDTLMLATCRRNFILDKAASDAEKDYYNNRVRTLENTGYYSSAFFSANTISKIAAQNISLNFIAEPSLTIFRKNVINKLGAFDSELKQICDLEFFLRIAANYGLSYIPEQLCRFRIHDQSATEKMISGKNYHAYYLEVLLFAAKLLTRPQFSGLRKSLSILELIKLKLYIKHKSYRAFKAISSKEDRDLYNNAFEKYGRLFFKKYDVVYLKLFRLVKP